MEISYLICLIFGIIILVETIYIITEKRTREERCLKRLEKIYCRQMRLIRTSNEAVTSFSLCDIIHCDKNTFEYKVCLMMIEALRDSGRNYLNLKDAYFYHEEILKIFFDDDFIEFYSQKDENGDFKYKDFFKYLKGENYDMETFVNYPLYGIKGVKTLSMLDHTLNNLYQEYRYNKYHKEREEEE